MNIVTEHWVPMRDGVKLYTLIQQPEATGKFPVVVVRTPYSGMEPDLSALAMEDTCGYAVVTQHCRGTARSEGVSNAYLNEREDGLVLLDWIRRQPFYDGELYLFGQSYLSSVHFSYLDTDPADVKAAFLAVQDTERYNICYRNGFFKPGLHGKWVLDMHRRNQDIERNYTIDTFRTMPMAGMTRTALGEFLSYIEESFLHPDPADPYWNTREGGSDYRDACNRCSVPIMLATSWYDIYTGGVFDMWRKLRPDRRKRCALVVTPFSHGYDPAPEKVPPEMREFLPDGSLRSVAPNLRYKWFDHFRLGTPLDFAQLGMTTYYRMWDKRWITVPELVNAPQSMDFHLAADRRLLPGIAEAGEATYVSNPYDPATFPGGVCNNFGGMQYQPEPSSRYDIVSFVSEPLTADLVCEGSIEVELHCRSTAEDTCFYVRLDVGREGKWLSLRDDIDSVRRHVPNYTPGEECVIKYTLAPHAFRLRNGDRLRLDVSSSCAPHFQIHTNRPGIQALRTTARICRNTILAGKSFVRLFVRRRAKS